jgi:hypothetical protein
MKKLLTLFALIVITTINAQAPQGFNYQATVRNSSGALVINQNVNFKFNIMLNSQTSLPVYSETHQAPTDDLGQVNLVIGTGTATTTGSFSSINWGTGNYFLGIELNTGSGYVAMGTTQLLSVPYAFYANSSGNAQATTPNLASVLAVNNSANSQQIKNLANPTAAQDAVTKSFLETSMNRVINKGDNTSNPTYLIPDNTDIYFSEEGLWNLNVMLPTPNSSNNFLYSRIGKFLLLKCSSSFSFNILTNNTDLTQNLNLVTNKSALFIFDGYQWKKVL